MSDPQNAKPQQDAVPSQLLFNQLKNELKDMRAYIAALETNLRNSTFLGVLRRIAAKVLGVRLHRLIQHPSMPLRIPEWYKNAKAPANPPTISIVTPSFNQGRF